MDPHSQAARNASHKVEALTFWRSNPHPRICVHRNLARIAQAMMRKVLFLGSKQFETKERAKAARGERRTFRLSVLASGPLESAALDAIWRLYASPELWEMVLPRDCTVNLNALAFRMLSRLGCQIERDIAQLNKRMKMRIVRCDGNAE